MVYVSALQDSLQRKLEVLQAIERLTTEQSDILAKPEPDMERFEQIIQEKGERLEEMKSLDQGFDALFAKLRRELQENKYQYQSQITQMQNLIRAITDCGIKIEGMEKRNKNAFQNYLTGARREIRNFKRNNQTASVYSQNMANQHHDWQTYFFDEKK